MRKAIFITVRKDSSRLPDKAVKLILGRTVLEMIIIRAQKTSVFNNIVVCTTDRQVDDPIADIARSSGADVFRGSTEDKLMRWLGALRQYQADMFVTMDGDDLLCDPSLMEVGALQMETGGYDFINAPPGFVCGGFTYAIRGSALEKVCRFKGTSDTEMQWVYFENTGMFNISGLNVQDPVYYSENIRLTLDYEEDLQFFRRVFAEMDMQNNDVPLREVMMFLNSHEEITAINSFRSKDWADNQKNKTKLVLKGDVGNEGR